MKIRAKIALVRQMIKIIPVKTNDKCKGYYPGCPNCELQVLRGHLWDFLSDLEFELKEKYETRIH